MSVSSKLKCYTCGEPVIISQSVFPGVVNVVPCHCMVKGISTNTERQAAIVWNEAMANLQRVYGKHVVGDGVFKPLPPELDRFGYPIEE